MRTGGVDDDTIVISSPAHLHHHASVSLSSSVSVHPPELQLPSATSTIHPLPSSPQSDTPHPRHAPPPLVIDSDSSADSTMETWGGSSVSAKQRSTGLKRSPVETASLTRLLRRKVQQAERASLHEHTETVEEATTAEEKAEEASKEDTPLAGSFRVDVTPTNADTSSEETKHKRWYKKKRIMVSRAYVLCASSP
jgi:hypothetical protein